MTFTIWLFGSTWNLHAIIESKMALKIWKVQIKPFCQLTRELELVENGLYQKWFKSKLLGIRFHVKCISFTFFTRWKNNLSLVSYGRNQPNRSLLKYELGFWSIQIRAWFYTQDIYAHNFLKKKKSCTSVFPEINLSAFRLVYTLFIAPFFSWFLFVWTNTPWTVKLTWKASRYE